MRIKLPASGCRALKEEEVLIDKLRQTEAFATGVGLLQGQLDCLPCRVIDEANKTSN